MLVVSYLYLLVNCPLYLLVNHARGYIKEKNGNEYLIFDDSKKMQMQMFGMELKKIGAIKGSKENNYEKDYMKIMFNSCH